MLLEVILVKKFQSQHRLLFQTFPEWLNSLTCYSWICKLSHTHTNTQCSPVDTSQCCISSAAFRFPLFNSHCSPVLWHISEDKYCAEVSELYMRPFHLICFVFAPDYCSVPCAFVLVTQPPSFSTDPPFFLPSSPLSPRLASPVLLILFKAYKASLVIAATTDCLHPALFLNAFHPFSLCLCSSVTAP